MPCAPKAVDLFCGAGGLSKGLEMAGFRIVLAVDRDDSVAQTYSYNHPNTVFVQADLLTTRIQKIIAAIGLKRLRPDILVGGPPCEGFSNANTTTRGQDNPRNRLIWKFIDSVEKLQPVSFLMENVPNVAFVQHGAIVNELIAKCERLGYSTRSFILDAANYGVPQFRRRFLLIGCVDGPVSQPDQTHKNAKHQITVRDAIIGDLPRIGTHRTVRVYEYTSPPKTPYQHFAREGARKVYNHVLVRSSEEILERTNHIRPGGNFNNVPRRYRRNLKIEHSYMYRRLNPNKPAHTIVTTTKAMTWHPYQNRAITIREAARLQSFQDNYLFLGSLGSTSKMVADAVPPLLARAIFMNIKRMLNGS